MPLFEVATLKTVDTEQVLVHPTTLIIAKTKEQARTKAILRQGITEEDLENHEVLVRPFVR